MQKVQAVSTREDFQRNEFCPPGMDFNRNKSTVRQPDSSNLAVDVDRVEIWVGLLTLLIPFICFIGAFIPLAVKILNRYNRDVVAMNKNLQTTSEAFGDTETNAEADDMHPCESIAIDEEDMERAETNF